MPKHKRILVTGGAGFIGSHLVEALAANDHYEVITVTDRLSTGSLFNLAHVKNKNLSIIQCNVADYDEMAFILNRNNIDMVCHLAVSPLIYSLKEPCCVFDNIVNMQKTLLECQRKGYFKRLISFSTSEVYGSSDGLVLTEEHRLSPRTPYSAAKAAADLLTIGYGVTWQGKVDYTIIRPFNNFGPRKRVLNGAGIIPTTIMRLAAGLPVQLVDEGKTQREFVFVKDTVGAVLAVIENEKASSRQIFNIATGIPRKMIDVVNDIARLMNVKPSIEFLPSRDGDVSYLCGDGSKIQRSIGFTPECPWEKGLEECINYYTNAPLFHR